MDAGTASPQGSPSGSEGGTKSTPPWRSPPAAAPRASRVTAPTRRSWSCRTEARGLVSLLLRAMSSEEPPPRPSEAPTTPHDLRPRLRYVDTDEDPLSVVRDSEF